MNGVVQVRWGDKDKRENGFGMVSLFQIILGHENSEPRVTHCVCNLRKYSAHNVVVIWITDWKRCYVLPNVLCLSQLVDYAVIAFRCHVWVRNLFEVIIESIILETTIHTQARNFATISR